MKAFDWVQGIKPKLNKFDLSHENKLTFNMGKLVPILCQEVLPGDSWRVNSQILLRMQALIAPVMHRVDVWTHYFFVPNRLVWDEWEDFITGGEDGLADPIHPYFDLAQVQEYDPTQLDTSTLVDYLGLQGAAQVVFPADTHFEVNALPIRAYNLIVDQWYRDQNYSPTWLFDGWKASGNTYTNTQRQAFFTLRDRAWEHDYFTSALPFSQRGQEVNIASLDALKLRNIKIVNDATDAPITSAATVLDTGTGSADGQMYASNGGVHTKAGLDVETDLGITVDSLRQSMSLQGFLEAMARFGSRYMEYLRGVFGTKPQDSRLQRAEYLGGGVQQIVISEVLQTGQPTGDGTGGTSSLPQGNMAGHGISVGRTNGFNRSFPEHGFVIGIMSVLPKTAYNSNVNKMWMRASRLDYYQPHLAHLGEQPVIGAELQPIQDDFTPYTLSTTTPNYNNTEIGYQSRFAEYKYVSSQQHGDFNGDLSFWTMTRMYDGTAPVYINDAFIRSNPTTAIFAVTELGTDHMLGQIYHEISVLRPIPLFSTPSLLFPAHA